MDEFSKEVKEYSLCGHSEVGEEIKPLHVFKKAASLKKPFEVSNQIINLDTEDPIESEIYFGISGETDPREAENNYFEINEWGDENDLHFHMYSDEENLRSFWKLYTEMASVVQGIEFEILTVWAEYNINFNDLKTEIKFDQESPISNNKLTGIRFDVDVGSPFDILIQDTPQEQSKTFIRFAVESDDIIKGNEEVNFIEEKLEAVDEILGAMNQ